MAARCALSLSPQISKTSVDMGNGDDPILLRQIWDLYESLSELPSLKPSPEVNALFSKLVLACVPHSPIDVSRLSEKSKDMRWRLIRLCGEAEGLLESHFSQILGSFDKPLDHVEMFPYYGNYVKLARLEHEILRKHSANAPTRVAFIGSGPLPLTSIVLAQRHLRSVTFHNYDIDGNANAMARRLVAPDPDLSARMFFHTADIMEVTHALRDYDVVFLAALVGMTAEAKNRVLNHLAKYMAPGAALMLRSAHGARAFLYPIVDLSNLRCFELLSVFHPTDDVINSVVISRKLPGCSYAVDLGRGPVMFPCKCSSEVAAFNGMNHGFMMEEMTALEEPAS
ncbi:nicotianamine synthase 1 [Wolffia australiana]